MDIIDGLLKSSELNSFDELSRLTGEAPDYLQQWATRNLQAFTCVVEGACFLIRFEAELAKDSNLKDLVTYIASIYKAGEKLPSDEKLPHLFSDFTGKSKLERKTCRELLKWLEVGGYVKVSHGSGKSVTLNFHPYILEKLGLDSVETQANSHSELFESVGAKDLSSLGGLLDSSADELENLENNHINLFRVLIDGISLPQRLSRRDGKFAQLVAYIYDNFEVNSVINGQRNLAVEIDCDELTIRENLIRLEAHGYLFSASNDRKLVKKSLSSLV